MVAGAAGADFVGALTREDQGGVPVSGWRRRSVPDARPSGVWGWPERAPRYVASHLMPWSAAAGEGPALLCYNPPHCRPCSGVGLDVADAVGCLEPEQSAGGFMASEFSVPSGGVGACRCARIMEVVLWFRFASR
jgi:hypothetical protein